MNRQYDTGITIEQIKLQDANAPDIVKPALREVEEAKQEKERMRNEAMRDYNEAIPKARGQAQEVIERAKGYATERLNHAKGDAERFKTLEREYKKAPQVTRTRIYIETINEVLPKIDSKTYQTINC